MSPTTIIINLLAGGILGMLGQSIRVIVGLRKMAVRNEVYEASRMFTSLVIGFTAGALGMISLHFKEEGLTLDSRDILLLISIGYAGVDFIEGFYRTVFKTQQNTTNQNNSTTASTTSINQVNTFQPEAAEVTNREVKIAYGRRAKPETISLYGQEVIKDILRNSNNYKATVTSTARTPFEQARAMYNNLVGSPQNIIRQRQLYGPNGDQVIDVFEAAQNAAKPREEILAEMEAKIIELGPSNVSKHCADFNKLIVVDIAPSSIRNKNDFIRAVKADERVSRFFGPPNDPAYHLEIPNRSLEEEDEFV